MSKKTRLTYMVVGVLCCIVAVGLFVRLMKSAPPPTNEAVVSPVQAQQTPAKSDLTQEDLVLGAVHGYGNENTLVSIPSDYTTKQELVHERVLSPLLDMINLAHQEGVELTVVSAYRSYDRQKRIWESKWGEFEENDIVKAQEILRYSSFPGTSRHHWGTDVDFNSVSPTYWQSAEGERIFTWLKENAPRFGFCQVYGSGRKSGYEVEAWHWSHLETAETYYQKISQTPVLNVALEQPVHGAAAVRELAPQMMNYITNINTCQVGNANAL